MPDEIDSEYYEFADNCYNEGLDLGEAIRGEIVKIIEDAKTKPPDQADKIMELIYHTKYEW